MNEGGEEMDVEMMERSPTPQPASAPGPAFRVERHERVDPDAALPLVFDVRDLSVFYGDVRAVKDVTLPVLRNRITALIGPSGCGKTTVLRCLNRMNDLIENA